MPETTAHVTTVYISVNNRDIDKNLIARLTGIVVESALGYPDTFTMSFIDKSVDYIDASLQTFAPGNTIKIEFQPYGTSQSVVVFDGEITSISPEFSDDYSATLVVSGYDKRHRLMRGTNIRPFVKMSDSDIVKKIAGEVGLSPSVDSTSGTRDHVIQDNQTNMEFLEELAKRNGFQVYVDGSKLNFKKPDYKSSTVPLKWGRGGNLISFRVRLSSARQVDEVIVRGWDSKTQKPVEGTAKSSKTAPSINVGKTGSKFASTFGSVKSIEVRQPVVSANDAKNMAQAIFDDINSQFVEAEGLVDAEPKIKAGVEVEISNIGSKFSGKYHVTNAKHYLEDGIYQTEFRVEGRRPYLMGGILEDGNGTTPQGYPLWAGIYPAVVTNNTDPDKLNRVKVKYPWLSDDVESNWARVVTVGAGSSMGTHWLPEINDEVVVAFEHGNFNHPYIVGGVYSQKYKPPEESQEGNPIDKRVMKSRSGNMIIMDDTKGSENITFKTGKGHVVSMDDKGESITFTSKGNKSIKIDDKSNKISIEGATTVDIKSNNDFKAEGTTVTIKGNATVKVEAKQVEVNGTAMVKIAGGLIQIG